MNVATQTPTIGHTMGAFDGLPPVSGFPTNHDRLERAFTALPWPERRRFGDYRNVRFNVLSNDPIYDRTPRWLRRQQNKEYMESLQALEPSQRAAHGYAVKLLRMAMVQYRLGLPPVAFRPLLAENQEKIHGGTGRMFAELVEGYASTLTMRGCTIAVDYEESSRSLILAIEVVREPRFVPPAVLTYNFEMV